MSTINRLLQVIKVKLWVRAKRKGEEQKEHSNSVSTLNSTSPATYFGAFSAGLGVFVFILLFISFVLPAVNMVSDSISTNALTNSSSGEQAAFLVLQPMMIAILPLLIIMFPLVIAIKAFIQ